MSTASLMNPQIVNYELLTINITGVAFHMMDSYIASFCINETLLPVVECTNNFARNYVTLHIIKCYITIIITILYSTVYLLKIQHENNIA